MRDEHLRDQSVHRMHLVRFGSAEIFLTSESGRTNSVGGNGEKPLEAGKIKDAQVRLIPALQSLCGGTLTSLIGKIRSPTAKTC